MKEATGELNSTVIVVVAVGLLAAFFFSVIWPSVKGNFEKNADCANAVCDVGINASNNNVLVECYAPKDTKKEIFTCPYRG